MGPVCRSVARWLGIVLVATALSACTADEKEPVGKPSGLTYLGDEVVDVEQSMAEADEMWQRALRQWDQVIEVPDDARCWLVADDAGAVEQHGVCGPFRGLGTPAPEWVQIQFNPEVPETGSVRMVPVALSPDRTGVVRRSLTLVRGEDEEGDWDQQVAEPKGWPRKTLPVGHVETGPTSRSGATLVARGRVTIGGFVHTVRVVRPRQVQFADRGTYVPRRRGAFVEFRFVPFDSEGGVEAGFAFDRAVKAGDIRLLVTSGGRTWRGVYTSPTAEGAHPGQALVVNPPSGLFVLPRWDEPRFSVVVGKQRHPLRPMP